MLPRRLGFAETMIEGERRTDDLFDGTPQQAARSLANALVGMSYPQGLPDIKELEIEDNAVNASQEAKDWLADSKRRLLDAFNNPHSQFRQSNGEKYLDITVLGTAAAFTGESRTRSSLLFQTLHMKDTVVAFSEEGVPEALYHHRRMPLRWLEARFGVESLSQKSRDKLKEAPDEKIEVLHAVQPRPEGRPDALFTKNLPIEDLWIEVDEKRELMQGGFHEFPFIVPRWDTTAGEDYGRSPGMIALPDADTLQAMGETVLIAGQRAADPPLAVPNDGTFDAINTFPGGLAYFDVETAAALGRIPFEPIPSGTNLPITRDMQLDTREQVWSAFFRNVLRLPMGGPQMTATEIIARQEEFLREMGAIFGRLESWDTAPMVERAFMILLRAGAFLPIPPVLQGRNVQIVYNSPIKRIRQQIEAAAAMQWAEEMFALEQVRPGAADLVNIDALGRFSAEAKGVPEFIVSSPEEVERRRAARAKAMAEQRQAEEDAQAAQTAKTAGQADAAFAKAEETQNAG